MSVLGFSHIAIGVTDIDAAIIFYRDCLGLTVDADWLQKFSSDQGAELHGGRAIDRRTAWLRSPEGSGQQAALTLDQLYSPTPADHRSDIYDLGIHHLSFWVSDIDAIMARAQDMGYQVIMPHATDTKNYGEAEGGTIKSVFLKDPDGNLIQCDQRA